MSTIAIHKGGSGMTVVLRNGGSHTEFTGMIIWPNSGSSIYIYSNEVILHGCIPLGSDWLKYGYIYSYLLTYGSKNTDVHTFDLMNHVPANLEFVRFGSAVFGSAVESLSMGEKALKMDLKSLRKGEALECEITNSSGVILRGKLFRSKAGNFYVLHNESRANGSTPRDENWKQVSGYSYSWCLLEKDLRNDCKPETYKFIRPATLLYHYDEMKDRSIVAKNIIRLAMDILNTGHNIGARVRACVPGGGVLDGILIKQEAYYYILHDNASHQGEQPNTRLYSKDGYKIPFSWWLGKDLLKSTNFVLDTFELVHNIPEPMTEIDPMNPTAFSVGGIAESTVTKDAYSSSYDPHSFEKKEPKTEEAWHPLSDATVTVKKEELELILFKKSTAKVTRCDVQPMQSPQIITKNKK